MRPYGVATLLATYGKEGPQLYLVDPAGTTHVRRHQRLAGWLAGWLAAPAAHIADVAVAVAALGRSSWRLLALRPLIFRPLLLLTDLAPACPLPAPLLPPARPCPQRYFGTAVGKGRQGAKNEIEKLKLDEMTCREGIKAVAKM